MLRVRILIWWQTRVAREKLRHDLFERRFEVYQTFLDFLLTTTVQVNNEEEVKKAWSAKSKARFLFNAEVEAYLHEFLKQHNALKSLHMRVNTVTAFTTTEDRVEAVNKMSAIASTFWFGLPEALTESLTPWIKLHDLHDAGPLAWVRVKFGRLTQRRRLRSTSPH